MKIEYLGHSCFRIDDSLVIDPYKDGMMRDLGDLEDLGGMDGRMKWGM